jgi:hypothetical protein
VRNKHAYLNEENSRESRGMEVGMWLAQLRGSKEAGMCAELPSKGSEREWVSLLDHLGHSWPLSGLDFEWSKRGL